MRHLHFWEIDNVSKKGNNHGNCHGNECKTYCSTRLGNKTRQKIINNTIEGEISSQVPATYLQEHKNCTFVLDTGAATELTRNKTPWLVDESCEWTEQLTAKAIVWLCDKTGKSILSLTDKDYNDNGMSGLLTQQDSYDLNIKMFNRLQHTITGWPGGKPNADDTNRPERALPIKKRVIIFSPHPDDDVISMGGTFDRLVSQGHEVHVAYQTSGNIAVSDTEALKIRRNRQFHTTNTRGPKDYKFHKIQKTKVILILWRFENLKGISEEVNPYAATRYFGLDDANVHFLDLPFYETGAIKKNDLSDADVAIMEDIIKKVKPHQIYAAGDLADPHGTHKVCLDAVFAAVEQLKDEPFMDDCWLWLYRGAWHEWDINEIEMAVPMSPGQVLRKRLAIFCHQSQKDGVMFQGDDSREFWMRAEERNKDTAQHYKALGMADYAAIEAFVRYEFK